MSGTFDLDRYGIEELSRREGVKWRRDGGAVLPAWIADMDFPIASAISEAVVARVERDDLGYPDDVLEAAVCSSFARRSATRYAHRLDPADVIVVSDVVQSIYLALLTLTDPGDGVVFLTPAYPPFFSSVAGTGRRVVTSDLLPTKDGYALDLEGLRAVVRAERPRMLLLCNPHNPTGRVLGRDELASLGELACEADLAIVSDEIHADLAFAGATHVPIASVGPEVASRTVTLASASKAFNLAGMRCSVAAFGSSALRQRFDAIPERARGSVSVLGMVATVAAWEHGDEWLEAVLHELAVNRARVDTTVHARLAGVAHRPPEATYLAWLDFREAGFDDDPAAWLAAHARVALGPGPDFGPAGRGHARLNFATPPAVLDEMLERVAVALAQR